MPNPGQPTIRRGDTGEPVKRAQRALRRIGFADRIVVDGLFGAQTEAAVRDFQTSAHLVVDGVVGPKTWHALPSGAPMPVLRVGSSGAAVRSLQSVLTESASGWWEVTPGGIDGEFGPKTKASVEAFQRWGGVSVDGIVGQRTWDVALGSLGTLEIAVGLEFVQELTGTA